MNLRWCALVAGVAAGLGFVVTDAARRAGALPSVPVALKIMGDRWLDRSVKVTLSKLADEPTRFVRDGEVWLELLIPDAAPVGGLERDGQVVHHAAVQGHDLRRKALENGVEDCVDYESAPAEPRLRYQLELGRAVAGLRLVENVLELLDSGGAPRFAVRRPQLLDARGAQSEPQYVLSGCQADRDPRPPQGRAVTPPGARRCVLDVDFSNLAIRYPAVLDPAWTSTAAPTVLAPFGSSLFSLPDGKVLHVSTATLRAEVWDPVSGTFATTGSPLEQRHTTSLVALEGGSVAVVAGSNDATNKLLDSVERYDPATGSFVRLGKLNTAKRYTAVTELHSGKLLVAGGCIALTNGLCSQRTASTELFDLSLGTSSAGPQIPWLPRTDSFAVTLADGRALVGSGSDGTIRTDAYVYSSSAGFVATGDMTDGRYGGVARLLPNGTALVFSGTGKVAEESYQGLTTAETFDPQANAGRGAFRRGPDPDIQPYGSAFLGERLLIVGDRPWTDGARRRARLLFPGRDEFVDADPPVFDRFDGVAASTSTAALLISFAPAPAGVVLTLLDAGDACTGDGQCAGGQCNGGFCCDGACAEDCSTCASGSGACEPVVGVEDPDSCVFPKLCGPSGHCGLRPTQPCSVNTDCANDFCVDGYCCTTACEGSCETCAGLAPGICLLVVGDAAPGRAPCLSSGECGGACDGVASNCAYPDASRVCQSGCEGTLLLRQTCDGKGACSLDEAQECAGGFACFDGACLTSCAADEDCTGGRSCVDGACLGGLGSECTEASACAAGRCVDGVCCDSACDGQCEACDIVDSVGSCAPSSGTPHGARAACDGTGVCKGQCNGAQRDTCAFPATETICSRACSGTLVAQGECGGDGQCVEAEAGPCPGNFACVGFECLEQCESDRECRDGFQCESVSGRCVASGQRCDDNVSVSEDGVRQDCQPYRCRGGVCPGTCSTSTECVDAFVCGNATCIPIPGAGHSDSGGCSIVPRSVPTGWATLLTILGAVALRGARRRSS